MTVRLDRMFALGDLREHPLIAMHVVMATRLSFIYARAGRDPLPDLAVRLRSMRAAQTHLELMSTMDRVWPEPFSIRPPCCMAMSPDEMLLAEVATAALNGDRRAAMDVMKDLLPRPSSDRLFRHLVELVDAIRSVPAQQPGPLR